MNKINYLITKFYQKKKYKTLFKNSEKSIIFNIKEKNLYKTSIYLKKLMSTRMSAHPIIPLHPVEEREQFTHYFSTDVTSVKREV